MIVARRLNICRGRGLHPSGMSLISASQIRLGAMAKWCSIRFGRDRRVVTAGGANLTRECNDFADALPMHQPFDTVAAEASSLRPQLGANPRTAKRLTAVPMRFADISRSVALVVARGLTGRSR